MATNTELKVRVVSRTAAYIDVGELISGVLLFIFIFSHLALVFTVVFGANGEFFNSLSKFLEKTYLAQLVLVGVVLLILSHVILVISRVPVRWQDHMAVLRLGNRMKHFDTMLWFLQAGSGFLLFAFAFAHIWNIFLDLPIEAVKSAEGIQRGSIWFYVPFLFLVAIHVAAGFYRVMVKWDFIPRKLAVLMSWFLFIFYIAVAFLNMSIFMRIPVGG